MSTRPQHTDRNLAARMGRWSASHWKTATFGWLAFVARRVRLGGAIGTKIDRPDAPGPGESGRMDRILDAGLQAARRRERPRPEPLAASERPRLQGGGRGRRRPHLEGRAPFRTCARRSSPATRARSQRTATRLSSSSRSAATRTMPPTRSARCSPASTRLQQAHPELFIGEFGDASTVDAVHDRLRERPRQGRAALAPGHAAHPRGRVRRARRRGHSAAARADRRLRDVRPDRDSRATCCRSRTQAPALVLLIGLAVGVDYSMFYLKREREERAAGAASRPRSRPPPRRPAARCSSPALTVIVAMAGMFLTGDQIFASLGVATITRRRDRDARLADRAAGAALEARRQGRPRPGSARRPPAPRRRREPDLGRDHRPRPAPAAPLGRRSPADCCWPSRRRRSSCTWRMPGPDTFPQVARRRAGLRPDAAGVPRHGAAGERRRQGAERRGAAGQARRSRSSSSGRSRAAACTSRSRVDVNRGGDRREHLDPDRRQGRPTRTRTPHSRCCATKIVPETVGALPDTEAGVTGLTAQWKDSTRRAEVEPAARRRLRPPASRSGCCSSRSARSSSRSRRSLLNLLSVAAAYGVLVLVFQHGIGKGLLGFSSTAGIDPGGPAAALRDPVRALDGLPRPHPQPDPGGCTTGAQTMDDAIVARDQVAPPASSPAPRS